MALNATELFTIRNDALNQNQFTLMSRKGVLLSQAAKRGIYDKETKTLKEGYTLVKYEVTPCGEERGIIK